MMFTFRQRKHIHADYFIICMYACIYACLYVCIKCMYSHAAPGFLPCPYLTDDAVHPYQLITHYTEKSQFIRCSGNLHTAFLAGHDQLLPCLHHFIFLHGNGFCLLSCVNSTELSGIFL